MIPTNPLQGTNLVLVLICNTLSFVGKYNFEKIAFIDWCYRWKPISDYEEGKTPHENLEQEIPFITSNDFCRLFSQLNWMLRSKHDYQRFLILTQSSVRARSQNQLQQMRDCFHNKLSTVWSYIFLLSSGKIAQTRNHNKATAFAFIKWHSQR